MLRNGKPIADIVPVLTDLPSWNRRRAQPLVLDGVSVSRMILEEREAKSFEAAGLMHVFFDSSAFVKRYISEAGTDAVRAWCDQATEIDLSGIALPEIVSAFCRLHRETRISDAQYRQLKSLLLADIEDAAICDLTPAMLAQGVSSLETNVLRGMDAIHIGSALALNADVFVPADTRQIQAAARTGLRAEAV